MRLVFAGTPAFASTAFEALIAAGHEVVLVLTQPDRPAGRGMRLVTSEVKRTATGQGVEVLQPETLKTADVQARLRATHADAMIVAAYGLLLPREVLDIFPLGCINIHASLLPRWRGAAPIQRAILAGDAETGISIMQMDAGLDTGPVYLMERIPIHPTDTAATLHDRLAALGARTIVAALNGISSGALAPKPQSDADATYAAKITRAEANLDWTRSAKDLSLAVRAFDPFPVAQSRLDGEVIRIWSAQALAEPKGGEAGVVLGADAEGIVVSCGVGSLRILELQRAGGRRLSAADFLRGFPVAAGSRLGR
ncbi:MAG: methionyl-tRNA formyltransferase [Burkholderiales bacterium]